MENCQDVFHIILIILSIIIIIMIFLNLSKPKSNFQEAINQCITRSNPLSYKDRWDVSCDALTKLDIHTIDSKMIVQFKNKFNSKIIFPWDNTYNSLRLNDNRRWNYFPSIIFMTHTVDDVKDALSIALLHEMPFSIRGGGHCYEPFSLSNGIIIDQSSRKGIIVYPEEK